MNDDDQCAWGRAIKAEFKARPEPKMPDGWTREFIEHWSCTPAFEYLAPKAEKLESWMNVAIRLTHNGIELGHSYVDIDPADLSRVLKVILSDWKWLKKYERDHGLECTHGVEKDAAKESAHE